jgi:putative transcriptional regulator
MIKFRFRRLLRKRKISQFQASEITGIRPGTINAYYHGFVKRINVKDLNKMCRKFDCTVTDIIEYVPEKKQGNKRFFNAPIE